jgi:hypothetical protein
MKLGETIRYSWNRENMKRYPEITPELIQEELHSAAESIYGSDRTTELSEQIDHLSRMLAGVARQPLELPEYPLAGPAREERGER